MKREGGGGREWGPAEKKSPTKFESRAHFLLLRKETCGEQVLEPAVVEKGKRRKSIGKCSLYRSPRGITAQGVEDQG